LDSKQCGGIDLHLHSTASDGTYSPAEIIQMAAQIGLKAISITDHDTLEGSRQALQLNFPSTLRFITGVEISAAIPPEWSIGGGIHLLGYGVDPEDAALGESLDRFVVARNRRIDKIVDRLNAIGIDLTMAQVQAEVGDSVAGRPHVASAMINGGYATDVDDAFNRFLGNDRPAYVGKERLDCRLAIELIRNAGGIPVLAHPYLVPAPDADALSAFMAHLCDAGLQGIEVYYTRHTPEAVAQYRSIAEAFDLLATGGSDFHGHVTPDIQMGRGCGDLFVPTALFDALRLQCSPECTR
jgi:hypothetical protein